MTQLFITRSGSVEYEHDGAIPGILYLDFGCLMFKFVSIIGYLSAWPGTLDLGRALSHPKFPCHKLLLHEVPYVRDAFYEIFRPTSIRTRIGRRTGTKVIYRGVRSISCAAHYLETLRQPVRPGFLTILIAIAEAPLRRWAPSYLHNIPSNAIVGLP